MVRAVIRRSDLALGDRTAVTHRPLLVEISAASSGDRHLGLLEFTGSGCAVPRTPMLIRNRGQSGMPATGSVGVSKMERTDSDRYTGRC